MSNKSVKSNQSEKGEFEEIHLDSSRKLMHKNKNIDLEPISLTPVDSPNKSAVKTPNKVLNKSSNKTPKK